MAFTARFVDGPLAEEQHGRTFMAPSVPERLYLCPQRWDQLHQRTHDGWMLVGFAPGLVPEEPWPGQEEYALDKEQSTVDVDQPGEDWGEAVYVWVDPVEMRG